MTPRDDREDGVPWEDVGRELLRSEIAAARRDLTEASRDVEEALREGEAVTHEQVRQFRVALNHARQRVEHSLAPAAGVEPWGDPPPRIPYGVMYDLTDHPRAEGVDPQEYTDREVADE